MEKENLTEKISYRLECEEFRQIQRLVAGKKLSPGDWRREAAREKLAAIRAQASRAPSSSMATAPADGAGTQTQRVQVMSGPELALFFESVRLRWLLQEFLSCLARRELTPEACHSLIDQADRPDGPARKLAARLLAMYGPKSKPTN